jgi:hypothetical protein
MSNQVVYVVVSGDYEGDCLHAIFDNRYDAEELRDRINGDGARRDARVREYPLHSSRLPDRRQYRVWLDASGKEIQKDVLLCIPPLGDLPDEDVCDTANPVGGVYGASTRGYEGAMQNARTRLAHCEAVRRHQDE